MTISNIEMIIMENLSTEYTLSSGLPEEFDQSDNSQAM